MSTGDMFVVQGTVKTALTRPSAEAVVPAGFIGASRDAALRLAVEALIEMEREHPFWSSRVDSDPVLSLSIDERVAHFKKLASERV